MREIKQNNIYVIPVPKKVSGTDEVKIVKKCISCEKEEWKGAVDIFCKAYTKIYKTPCTEGEGGVRIIECQELASDAYRVEVDETVNIYASAYEGVMYGLATVLQLLNAKGEIFNVSIEDYPDKDYRGLMIDVARQWHPFYTLLHYVDLCFFFKIKYLHLHLSDDQSYTLPSEAFPKLPNKGKSYTKEQIKTLEEYAKEREIRLIPEIEMPGHTRILNERYPEIFSDTFSDGKIKVTVTENGDVIGAESIICAGSEKTFDGITKMIDETLELFPNSQYIHLGADEANYHAWDTCDVCQKYIKDHGLKNSRELYVDFLRRATDYVLSKGKTPILWEGFADEDSHMISKDVVVISWENHYQNTYDLLKNGYKIINCAWKPLYVVGGVYQHERYPIEEILAWNVYEWHHWWTESVASLNPIRVQPTDQVMGAQIAAWGLTYEREIYNVVNNLAAMSERVWTVDRICTDNQFQDKGYQVIAKAFLLLAEE